MAEAVRKFQPFRLWQMYYTVWRTRYPAAWQIRYTACVM
jgi:hypothetical protein